MDDRTGYVRRSRDLHADIVLFGSHIEVKVPAGNLEEEQVRRIIASIRHIADNKQYPVLVLPDKNTRISFFALKLLASEEAMSYTKATAYLIRSFHHQLMAETLLAMYTPQKPTRVFKAEDEALAWLRTFL